MSVEPYYLLAHIAEEQRDIEQAKKLFKQIIYLAPSSIAAYLEHGALYESEGAHAKARKMRNIAFELLKNLPPYVTIKPQNKRTVSELILQVKKLL